MRKPASQEEMEGKLAITTKRTPWRGCVEWTSCSELSEEYTDSGMVKWVVGMCGRPNRERP